MGQLQTGYAISIDDPNPQAIDRTGEAASPSGDTGYLYVHRLPFLRIYSIIYRDYKGLLHSLWRDTEGLPHHKDLTKNAPWWAGPRPTNDPAPTTGFASYSVYVDTQRNQENLIWNGGPVYRIWFNRSTSQLGCENLSDIAGAPRPAGTPVGYYNEINDMHEVIYRSSNGHLQELSWVGESSVDYGGDLTYWASPPAPSAKKVKPSAYITEATHDVVSTVIYVGTDNHIHSLFWKTGGDIGHHDLSGDAGTPNSYGGSTPFAYFNPYDELHQVVYTGVYPGEVDRHVVELFWKGNDPARGWDVTLFSAIESNSTPPHAVVL